ncbi:MAG: hypothetical protein AAF081_09320 [Actinomycetota bacterium]
MRSRRITILAATLWLVAACADDRAELTTATSTTTEPPPTETTYPTTAVLDGTPTTEPPTVTYPAVPPPSPIDGFTDFVALPVPAGIASCGVDDVWAREDDVDRSDFDYRVVHLINTSTTTCGLETGAVDEEAGVPVTNRVRGTWESADPVLAPGDRATVVLTSTAEARSGLEPIEPHRRRYGHP